MLTTLSVYSFESFEAVPVDVVLDGDRAEVVEPQPARCMRVFR